MSEAPVGLRRPGVGVLLTLTAVALWAIVFSVLWVPHYLFHIDGQLFLYPLALLVEAVVVALAVAGLIVAVVERVQRRIGSIQLAGAAAGTLLMVVVGPVLLWFGTIPFGADLVG